MGDEVDVTDNAIRINGQELRFFRQAGTEQWVYAEAENRPHPVPEPFRRLLSAVHPLLVQHRGNQPATAGASR
jgi:hypothetical protein